MSFSVCKFYRYNRNCKFGNNCRYLHCEVTQRPPPNSAEAFDNEAVKKESSGQPDYQSPVYFVETNSKEINHEEPLSSSTPTSTSDHNKPATTRFGDDASRSVISSAGGNPVVPVTESRNICRYFKQHGYCAFGRNCRFEHDNVSDTPSIRQPRLQNVRKQIPPRFQRKEEAAPSSKSDVEDLKTKESRDLTEPDPQVAQGGSVNDPSSHPEEDIGNNSNRRTGNASRENGKLCKYFRAGYCNRGRRCMFQHYRGNKVPKDREGRSKTVQVDNGSNDDIRCGGEMPQSSFTAKHPAKYERSARPSGALPQVVTLSDIQTNGIEKYRQFDVNYLEKRFQAIRCGNDGDEEGSSKTDDELTMEVSFSPSDPDWPFDISTFALDLTLPQNYPEKAMSVAVPSDKQELPETVRRFLEVTMNEWVRDRQGELTKNNKAELMVRPFFRWLDRNFEDVMTEALKQLKRELTARAAGFEFISATDLKAKYVAGESDDGSASQDEDVDSLAEDEEESSDECLESDDESDDDDEEEEGRQPALNLDTERKGTEIQLRHLQLKQNASSFLFEKLRLLVQCGRCKTHSEITVGAEKAVSLTCEKCSQEMYVQYRPTLAHQFSSVVGYLDLDNCTAFDLILPDCKIVVSCLACGKVTKVNGMTSGQIVDGWCQACNARFKFASEAVKFYQLQPSGLDEEKKKHAELSQPKASKKPPKDPAIREGQPLPDFGTCRHYKQSYRWLRFPCCGKAYPCDVCHDKKEDHEMILATRMICGHCCKEQNYSAARPCTFCGQHMTKVRSSHWEGGTGCRDRIAMSSKDQQKYKNMNKTISRKKGQSAAGTKKKNTKLRHA